MPDHFSTPQIEYHSLVDWLALSGVRHETQNTPSSWLVQEDTAFIDIPTVNAAISAVAPIQPLQQNTYDFADLAAFNAYILSYKELSLCTTSTHSILGYGQICCDVMIIAEAPDDQEDRSGQGFSGISQSLVSQALAAAQIMPQHVYKTYFSKWRPPGQRSLTKHEISVLSDLLLEEIKLVQPKAILALGESVVKGLLGDSLPSGNAQGKITSFKYQQDKKEVLFMASQKSEILVKTQSMKKAFWFSLLSLTASLRALGYLGFDRPALNELESSATFLP